MQEGQVPNVPLPPSMCLFAFFFFVGQKLHVQERLSVARGLREEGSGEPIAALNADLVAGIHFFSTNLSWGCVWERPHIHLVHHTESWLG